MWNYNETPEYIRCCEELGISVEVKDAIKSWARTVGKVTTNRQKLFHRSAHNIFEIWVARVPNPDANRGSSGGFRLVYFLNTKESGIYVDKIEHRADLGGKTERPRDQQRATAYLEELKEYLIRELESER
jgi:mRNA-degrading endonuclease RelE of RelBE toxin-antitoxin system